jgi:uncharacterized membrane protein
MEECRLSAETGPEEGNAPPPPPPAPKSGTFLLDLWKWGVVPRPKVLRLNLAFLIVLATWASLMWIAPYTVEEGSLRDLDGSVGLHDHYDDFENLNPVARFMYKAGDSQCHQKENRSYILNGNQMPFCVRDVAIYTFLAIGLAITCFPRIPYHDALTDIKWWWIIIGLVPIGIDGVGQLFGYWESTNILRLLTGGLCGAVVGIALGFMLREVGEGLKEIRADMKYTRALKRGELPPEAYAPLTQPPVEAPVEEVPEGGTDGEADGEALEKKVEEAPPNPEE